MIPSFLRDAPLVGIMRGVKPDLAVAAARAAARGGIRAIELTMNSESPANTIATLRRELPGCAIGAGTVMSTDELEQALAAGAQFIVSPHLDESIVGRCCELSVPVFPGAASATEVWNAHRAGATMVKLFPAGPLGPEYVRALLGPFPQINLMVTGGIDASNVAEYMAAGARAAAVGGKLFPRQLLIDESAVAVVESEARRLVRAIAAPGKDPNDC